MKLFESVMFEFITVVEYLLAEEDIVNDRIIIDKEMFKALLGKYAYLPFHEKTRIYKELNFIFHDKNSFTMPYKDPQTKKSVRMVIINYKAYEVIKELYSEEITA